MDYGKVLKRAWHILWSYRALWVFGIILALTTASPGGGGSGGSGYRADSSDVRGFNITPPAEIQQQMEELGEEISRFFQGSPVERVPSWIIALAVGLGCLLLIWIVVSIIARYVSEVALIRMVDDYEETGERRSVRQGLKLGWSHRAWRLFLLGLVIGLPFVVAFLLLFALAMAPLLLWTVGDVPLGIFGTVATIGLFFLVLFTAILVGVVVNLLLYFMRRACVLEDLGVRASIRRGFAMVRANWKPVGLMWLIMFGIRLGYTLLMIPVVLLVLAIGGVSGGLTLLMVRGIAGLLLSGSAAWITAAVTGGLVFFVLLMAPLVLVGGWYETFGSTTWTLTYRELLALEELAEESAPGMPPVDDSALEMA